MLMAMFMKENGSMIKRKVKVLILMRMGLFMMVNGLMINNMVMVLKNGLMEPATKVTTPTVRKKVLVN